MSSWLVSSVFNSLPCLHCGKKFVDEHFCHHQTKLTQLSTCKHDGLLSSSISPLLSHDGIENLLISLLQLQLVSGCLHDFSGINVPHRSGISMNLLIHGRCSAKKTTTVYSTWMHSQESIIDWWLRLRGLFLFFGWSDVSDAMKG